MSSIISRKIEQLRALANNGAASPAEAQTALTKITLLELRHKNHLIKSAQAILPPCLETRNYLCQMEVGQSGWTTPWAMVADQEGLLFLNAQYSFDTQQRGAVCLFVEHRSDGYHVWTQVAENHGYTWDRVSSVWGRDIPVREIHTHATLPRILALEIHSA